MPPARGTSQASSFQFIIEQEENVVRYRPYRNPSRIAINDRKRSNIESQEIVPQNEAHQRDLNHVLAASSRISPSTLSRTLDAAVPAIQLLGSGAQDSDRQTHHRANQPRRLTPSPSTPSSTSHISTPTYSTGTASPQTTSSVASPIHSPDITLLRLGQAGEQGFHHHLTPVAGGRGLPFPSHQKPTIGIPCAQGTTQNSEGAISDRFADTILSDFLHSPVPLAPNPIPSQVAHWQEDLFPLPSYAQLGVAGHAEVPLPSLGYSDDPGALFESGPSFYVPPNLPTRPTFTPPPANYPPPNFDIPELDDEGYGDRLFYAGDLTSGYLADKA